MSLHTSPPQPPHAFRPVFRHRGSLRRGSLRRAALRLAATAIASLVLAGATGAPVASAATSDYAAAVRVDAPAGWWRLGEASGRIAVDATGRRSGTYVGRPALGRTGLIVSETNKAVALDGVHHAVTVPSTRTLSPTAQITLEAWIRPTALPAAGKLATIMAKELAYALRLRGSSVELMIMVGTTRSIARSPAGTIARGGVYHVVGTYDGATQRVYVDGALVASASRRGAIAANTRPLMVGSTSGTSWRFAGRLDEAAVYRVALSDARVAAHADAGRRPPTPTPTPTPTPAPGDNPATHYVSPAGSDANPGTLDRPWRSFHVSLTKLVPGDTLYVRGGSYTFAGINYTTLAGTAAKPILIAAYPGETPVFTGTTTPADFLYFRGSSGWITLRGLTIGGGGTTSDSNGSSLLGFIDAAHDITISNVTLNGVAGWSNQQHLAYVAASGVRNIVFTGNTFDGKGCLCGGLLHFYHDPNAVSVTVTHNSFRNADQAVLIWGNVSGLSITSNTFSASRIAIRHHNSGGTTISGNTGTGVTTGVYADSTVNLTQYGNSW